MISVGVQWTPGPDGLTVARVIDGAPGAEAGLAAGDVLISVDATPAAQHTKTTLDRLFRQDDTPHAVIVRRGTTQHAMTVMPRSLL
jgi:C-terminal processing protease CtpA/Prc